MSEDADRTKVEFLRVREGRYDIVLVDSSSTKKPTLADEVIPNEFYTGLWNKSVSLALAGGYDNLFFVASDVQIYDHRSISDAVVEAAKAPKIGVYTPSIEKGSRCSFKQCLNRGTSTTRACEWVEGFCFLAKTTVLKNIFPVGDNKYGYNIDTATCLVARNMGYRVVVDDRVKIFHPGSQLHIDYDEAITLGNNYQKKIIDRLGWRPAVNDPDKKSK